MDRIWCINSPATPLSTRTLLPFPIELRNIQALLLRPPSRSLPSRCTAILLAVRPTLILLSSQHPSCVRHTFSIADLWLTSCSHPQVHLQSLQVHTPPLTNFDSMAATCFTRSASLATTQSAVVSFCRDGLALADSLAVSERFQISPLRGRCHALTCMLRTHSALVGRAQSEAAGGVPPDTHSVRRTPLLKRRRHSVDGAIQSCDAPHSSDHRSRCP